MKIESPLKWISLPCIGLLIIIMWIVIQFQLPAILSFHPSVGMPMVFAKNSYGILGQAAPEIILDNWINENGKRTAPEQLKSYRGKGAGGTPSSRGLA